MFCQHCGALIPEGAKFCGNCGERVEADVSNAAQQPVSPQHGTIPQQAYNPVFPETAPAPGPYHPPKVPWHSRGRLSPDNPHAKWVNFILVIAVTVLQAVLLFVFAAMEDSAESEMLTAQIIGFIPTMALIIYLFCLDTIEKEPVGLLLKLFLVEGILCLLVVAFVEIAFENVALLFLDEDSTLFAVVDNLICVALVEEGFKFLVLRLFTWKHKAFNYRFDGIVYAAVTALGFAAFENVLYILDDGLGTALLRMVSAVPGHCVDGILMGIFYGKAKMYAVQGRKAASKGCLILSLLAPIAEHGFYDFFAGMDFAGSEVLFFAYEFLLTAVVMVLVWRFAQKDEAITKPLAAGNGSQPAAF